MRGTLHMVAAEDVGWLVALLGPGFAAGNRRRRLQLGLDDRLCERALETLPAVLADGPLSRADLVRGPRRQGGPDPARGPGPGPPGRLRGHARPGLPGPRPGRRPPPATCCWRSGRAPARPWTPRTPWPSWPAATWPATARPRPRTWPPGPGSPSAGPGAPSAGRRRRAGGGRAGRPDGCGRRPAAPRARSSAAGPVVRLLGRFDDYLLGWKGPRPDPRPRVRRADPGRRRAGSTRPWWSTAGSPAPGGPAAPATAWTSPSSRSEAGSRHGAGPALERRGGRPRPLPGRRARLC